MNWYKCAAEKDEMEDWFYERTNKHIDLVREYCKKIFDLEDERFEGIIGRGEEHDESKFKDPEIDPYIYITWKYKCEKEGEDYKPPKDFDEKMNKATEHHVKNNFHHPESHCEKEVDLINKEDRDKPPEEIIDATKMGDLDIAEMCADWCSLSDERGGTPKKWADENINVRWKFTDKQKDLIYELIEEIWK